METTLTDEYGQIHRKLVSEEDAFFKSIKESIRDYAIGSATQNFVITQIENGLARVENILNRMRNMFDKIDIEVDEFDEKARLMEYHEQIYENILTESDNVLNSISR